MGLVMREVKYIVNLRHISQILNEDYANVLYTYKNCLGFLFGVSVASRRLNRDCLSFNDYFIEKNYQETLNDALNVPMSELMEHFLSHIDGFGRDVFNDLTFYIDAMMEKIIHQRLVGYVDITIDYKHELNVTVLRTRRIYQ